MTTARRTARSSAAAPRQRSQLVRTLWMLGLSGVLMTLSFPGFGVFPLALVALVPFVLCIIRRPLTWRWLGIYYLFGAIWFNLNLFWLWPVTVAGTIALGCFMGVYWLLFAWGTHRLIVQLRWPAVVAVPVMWVAAEYLRATVLTGFPWFTLGNALAGWPVLIQIADLFGVWGVSFFGALTAGAAVDVLRLPLYERKRLNPEILRIVGSYAVVLLFVLLYGAWRVDQRTLTPGPSVGVVQAYVPQDQKDSPSAQQQEDNFQRYMELSRQAAAEGAKLIAWPETMVPQPINPAWLTIDPRMFVEPDAIAAARDRARSFDARLKSFADASGAALLVGAPGRKIVEEGGRYVMQEQNLAVLFRPGEEGAGGSGEVTPIYAKRHLVVFGETVPFKDSWPWLHRLLLNLTPYSADYTLEPGDTWVRYAVRDPGDPAQPYRFGVPICYEDVMPYPAQQFVRPVGGVKQVDFLMTISNDGWYRSSFELGQHLQMDQLRAVEERVPVARSVNGGNSGFVDSDGRILKLVAGGKVLEGSDGVAVVRLPVDSRVSLYSRIGDLFPILCGIVAALAVAWTVVRPRRKVRVAAGGD